MLPHGADDDINVKNLCQKHGFEYDRPDTLIELYMLNLENPPKYVYGFSSTALFTIKKMFPAAEVFRFQVLEYPHWILVTVRRGALLQIV